MAEVLSLKDEFLTCSICTGVYTDPCTLKCQHSFCRKCVTDFIKTRPDAVQSKTIPCAFCRQDTKVPHPTRPVEEWAGQIKPSLMLQGLLDRLNSGYKGRKGQGVCFLCEEVGETTPATSWCCDCEVSLCGRCTKMHLKGPATRKHGFLDLSARISVKQRRIVTCKEHEGKQIKFICKDCKVTACQMCCTSKHTTCKNVVTVESVIPKIRSSLTEIKISFDKKMQESMAFVKRGEAMLDKLKEKELNIRSHINAAIESNIASLRKKESELLKELSDVFDKQIAELKADVKSGQITAQMYQQHCVFIDQALQSEPETEMYDVFQICQSGAVDSESENLKTPSIIEVKFIPNIEPLRKSIAEIGRVDVASLTGETPVTHDPNTSLEPDGTNTLLTPDGPSNLSTPVLHDTLDIKDSTDSYIPKPIDVTVLSVNGAHTVIVADYINKCLKSVHVKKGKVEISTLGLSDRPYSVVKTGRNRVVSTVSGFHIVVAEVRPKLVLISCLTTSTQYYGLTALPNSTLAVGSCSPAVDIIDLYGNVLRSFTPHTTGLNLMQDPRYLCTTQQGNILVSDRDSKSVYCLTSGGGIAFSFNPTGEGLLIKPQGVAVTTTGDILLADKGVGSQRIIQIRADGTFVRDILAPSGGIAEPVGLCVDDAGNLYVCETSIGNESIKTFRFW